MRVNNSSKWLDVLPDKLHPAALAVSENRHDDVDRFYREELSRFCGNLPVWVVEALARDENPRVRWQLSARLEYPTKLFSQLAHDEHRSVAYALLANRRCPSEVVHILFERASKETQFKSFVNDPFGHVLTELVCHPALPVDDLVKCPAVTVLERVPAKVSALAANAPEGLVETMSMFVGRDASIPFGEALELASLTLAQPV